MELYNSFKSWPLENIVEELQSGEILRELIAPKKEIKGYDTREIILENLIFRILQNTLTDIETLDRDCIGKILNIQGGQFPLNCFPDIHLFRDEQHHFCEIKSSRKDYNRFDNVFENRPFCDFMKKNGFNQNKLWEVEQDLIKLRRYKYLSPSIGSCLFIMVDGFIGSGRSWSKVFSNKVDFNETIQTSMVRNWRDKLLDIVRIIPIKSKNASANLIICEMGEI